MIIEYHRPKTLEEAMLLLSRKDPVTFPLAGGSHINRPSADPVAVVDLQDLPLKSVEAHGSHLQIGATATLQALLDYEAEAVWLPILKKAIHHEVTYNLRQVATAAGTLVAADGRSPFATLLLALDAQIILLPGDEKLSLGDLLPVRTENLRGRLITHIELPLKAKAAYEYVARTPADLPLVCAAVAQWPSGRTRVALGGFGSAPILAMDGPGADGAEQAARDAFSHAGDEWASAEYRQDVAATLSRRCIGALM